MDSAESSGLRSGDETLYRARWSPPGHPRAKLLLVHGFGEHSGRYHHLVPVLLDLGITVHAYDHRGHGRSTGQRGYIRRWSDFRGDLGAMLASVEKTAPALPTLLLGHSLGGLMVLDFVLRERPRSTGLIASAPVLGRPGVPPALLVAARLLSRVWPRFSMNAPIDPAALSRDPAEAAAYRDDPLVHGRATARLSTELERTVAWVNAHAAELDLPLLILHGGADQVAPPEASAAFFERVGSGDKERIEYPGGRHEPHNDTNRNEVLADLGRWLAPRLPG